MTLIMQRGAFGRRQPFYKRSDQVEEFVGDDDNHSLSNQSLLERLHVCIWFAFCGFWKEHFLCMNIRSPSRDVCGHCYVWKNAFRHHEGLGDNVDKDDLKDDLTIHSVSTVAGTIIEPAPAFFQSKYEITVVKDVLIKAEVHVRAQFAIRELN
jgi:hypothetical protein